MQTGIPERRLDVDRRGAFCELLTRYRQAPVGLIVQCVACRAIHIVEQRLARWLLTHGSRETAGYSGA
jgi:hypothetical protein